MKQYVIDELRLHDYEKIKAYMDENFSKTGVSGLYWLPVPEELLTEIQAAHTECGPFCFGAELEEDRISFELLVRARGRIRCGGCIGYADEHQRKWLMDAVDAIFEKLEIIT